MCYFIFYLELSLKNRVDSIQLSAFRSTLWPTAKANVWLSSVLLGPVLDLGDPFGLMISRALGPGCASHLSSRLLHPTLYWTRHSEFAPPSQTQWGCDGTLLPLPRTLLLLGLSPPWWLSHVPQSVPKNYLTVWNERLSCCPATAFRPATFSLGSAVLHWLTGVSQRHIVTQSNRCYNIDHFSDLKKQRGICLADKFVTWTSVNGFYKCWVCRVGDIHTYIYYYTLVQLSGH